MFAYLIAFMAGDMQYKCDKSDDWAEYTAQKIFQNGLKFESLALKFIELLHNSNSL